MILGIISPKINTAMVTIMTSIKKRIRVVVKINSLETNHRFVNETVNTIRSRDKKLDQKMIRIVSQKEP